MTINELREKRNQAWNAAKAFVETKRNEDGLLSEEDAKTYAQMEKKVQDYGAEIERMESMSALDAQLSKINAESGEIAGWCIAGSANPPNGFWNYSLSSVIKNNTTKKQYAVFLRGGKTLNSGNVIIGIKEMSTDYQSNSTNWSNSKKSDGTYPSDAEYSLVGCFFVSSFFLIHSKLVQATL